MYGAIEATQLRAIVFCFKRYSGHVTRTNGVKLVTAQVVWGLREAKPADKCLGIGGQGFDDLPALLLGGRDKRADGREVLSPLIRAEAA